MLLFIRTALIGSILPILICSLLAADEPIRELDIKPNEAAYRNRGRVPTPILVQSSQEAEPYFERRELARLLEQVDFKKQFVLVYAWRGSGQDRLEYDVAESYPEQIVFRYTPGRTRDLRPHSRVYVLRSNVRWTTPDGRPGQLKPKPPAEYFRVEILGKLNSEVMAIGGETTGVILTARGLTVELDFSEQPELRRKASQLNGKMVVVKGDLAAKRGVEIRTRWIVQVNSLDTPAKAAQQ